MLAVKHDQFINICWHLFFFFFFFFFIFKLQHFLRLGMQNGEVIYIFLEVFQKTEILKMPVSERWCKDNIPFHISSKIDLSFGYIVKLLNLRPTSQ